MKNVFKGMGLLLLLVAFTFSTGCTSPKEPEHRPKLGVAQNSDGIITFVITTHPEYIYSIYYEDPKTRAWNLMPGCDSIRGNGEQVEIKKQFNSRGTLPSFTVRHAKIN